MTADGTQAQLTTDLVRAVMLNEAHDVVTGEQFDRWLAGVKREARRQAADEIEGARQLHEPDLYYPPTRQGDISFGTDEGLRRAVIIARGPQVTP